MIVIKRIHQLPVYLANQIAAGEVIERPASVLKELLENSLDAKSTEIEVNIERGGIGTIRVQDNGVGICKEDLKLALSPHATSKIESLSDLEGIISYGFRGEALASISAVSRLRLSSATENQELGWGIQMDGRDAAPVLMPVPKYLGTLIEVRDLFYNTPARRKFLRSEKTEMSYLDEVFKRVALSQPQVAFKFSRENRIQKRLPACRSIEAHTKRVALLCGQSFVNEAYYIEAEANGLKLTGWLGSTKAMRSQTDLQYFYVNGRIVRDKVVMHAVRQAYQRFAVEGRYPAYILYFELDPTAVDVNVHPTKHEVRFREARTVHAFLSYAIQEGLKKGDDPGHSNAHTIVALHNIAEGLFSIEEDASPIVSHGEFKLKNTKEDFPSLYQEVSIKPDTILSNVNTKPDLDRILGVLGETLLFVENKEGVAIIDIKMACKVLINRILVDSYQQGGVKRRTLIMPKLVVVSKKAGSIETSNLDWERLGFEMTEAGENAVLVRSVPDVFGTRVEDLNNLLPKLLALSDVSTIFRIIVDSIVENQKLELEQQRQLLADILKLKSTQQNNGFSKFYKQFTAEQLQALLF